jgi:DNA-binding CsgD family transcriptional regulator
MCACESSKDERCELCVLEILIEVIVRARTIYDLCRLLIHDVQLAGEIASAHFYYLNSNLEFSLISGYGESNPALDAQAVFGDDSPASKGVQEMKPVLVKGPTKSIFATLPLQRFGIPFGSCVLTLRPKKTSKITSERVLAQFSIVASRFLEGSLGSRELAIHGNAHGEGVLSSRQIEILNLMAKGQSNPQIARHLNVSDSTVRHETMKIYKTLGIAGRKDLRSLHLEKQDIQLTQETLA